MWSNKGSEIKCAHKLGTKMGRPTDPNFGPKSLPEGPRDTLGSGKWHPKSVPGASRSSPERRKATGVPKVGQTDAESRRKWAESRPKVDRLDPLGTRPGPQNGQKTSPGRKSGSRQSTFVEFYGRHARTSISGSILDPILGLRTLRKA